MRKKSVFVSFAAAAVLCLCVPAAAETFTSEDGVLSIELPNENWREITDVNKWIALSDGGNSITVEHYSNGEKLPDITVADNHYVNVYQAVFSTQNEVFIITGSVVDAAVIPEIANAIMSAKVLRYDTKLAVKNNDQAVSASDFSLAPLDKTMYVTSDGLNVRTGCSTDDQIIGAFVYGAVVHVTGAVQKGGVDIGWYQVSYDSGTGYVSSGFLSDSQPEARKTTASTESGSNYTSEVKTLYDINGDAVTVYKSTDGYWYDKPGMRYTQVSDYAFTAEDGKDYSVNKPPVGSEENYAVGLPFTVYWQNGNATQLAQYSDGYFYSSDWIRYTSDGTGVYYGADGTTLYIEDPWTSGAMSGGAVTNDAAEVTDVEVYNAAGTVVRIYKAQDGYWYDKSGTQYDGSVESGFVSANGDRFFAN